MMAYAMAYNGVNIFLLAMKIINKLGACGFFLILVYIKTVKEGERSYDKLNSCFFCKNEYCKVARHMQQVHGEEAVVKKAVAHKKKECSKNEVFEKLCRLGNYNHNIKVLELKKGELKVVRRPSHGMDTNPSNYLPCTYCHGFFQKDELWRHAPKCPFKEGVGEAKVASKRMQYEGRFMLSSKKYPEGCSKQLSENVI